MCEVAGMIVLGAGRSSLVLQIMSLPVRLSISGAYVDTLVTGPVCPLPALRHHL